MITIIQPSIDPVIASFGNFSIRWYGLSYVVGIVFGIILIKNINKNLNFLIKNKVIDDFFIWVTLGVILGGRIGYMIFYQTSELINNPFNIFYIWKGGMSFHGGLIGVILVIFLFCYIKKINFFIISDFVSTVAPIGLFFGRIANFINTELYGRITDFPFAIIYNNLDNNRRHPSQLYEAFFEGIFIFVILMLISKNTIKVNRFGINTSIFLILYGFIRFFIEFLREPDSHIGYVFSYFTMGQILSVPLVLLGMIIYIKVNKRNG